MGAGLHDAPALQDEDPVGVEHGVEAVGDGDDSAAFHQTARGFFQQGLGGGVEAGGGFIQQEQWARP